HSVATRSRHVARTCQYRTVSSRVLWLPYSKFFRSSDRVRSGVTTMSYLSNRLRSSKKWHNLLNLLIGRRKKETLRARLANWRNLAKHRLARAAARFGEATTGLGRVASRIGGAAKTLFNVAKNLGSAASGHRKVTNRVSGYTNGLGIEWLEV